VLLPAAQTSSNPRNSMYVSVFVLSRLDYCNVALAGLPVSTLASLQRVLHAAARLVLRHNLRGHVAAALRELHWLPIAQSIDYKLCWLVYKVAVGQAPAYIHAGHDHSGR
jgi:hypothetical protein